MLSVVGSSCGFRTKADIQRDYARTLEPAPLAHAAAPPETARELPVRILVDEDYRAEILRWRERILAQVERANRVLEAQFGVRLAVKAIQPWPRSGRKQPLASALADLLAADAGDGVDWVIAFVSSSELFSGSHEQLGMAPMFGRHLVLRGMVSFEEGEAVTRALDALSEAERDNLLRDRQLHREAAVLLHEWGHTLGAFHERSNDSLMSPRYDRSQAAFSLESARIIWLGLHRRGDPRARLAWARDYRAEVERARAAAWDTATAQAALDAVRVLESAPETATALPPKATATPAPTAAPAEDASALAQAEMNDRLGDHARAWALIRPIAERFPERGQLQKYACYLRQRAEPRSQATRAACRSAKPLDARAASVLFARVLSEHGDRAGAFAALLRAEAIYAASAAPRKEWADLAATLARANFCTLAERAAARAAGEDDARLALAECLRIRRDAVLVAGPTAIDAAREPEYVDAVKRGRAQAGAGRLDQARATSAALEAAFPGSPGSLLVRCLIHAQTPDTAVTRSACSAADAVAPASYEPPYVLAMIAGGEGRWGDARDLFLRALERDDGDRGLWERLGVAYQRLRDPAGLEKLDARHRARFGRPLRPTW